MTVSVFAALQAAFCRRCIAPLWRIARRVNIATEPCRVDSCDVRVIGHILEHMKNTDSAAMFKKDTRVLFLPYVLY